MKRALSASSSSATTSYDTLLSSLNATPRSIPHLHQIHALIITNGFSSKSVLDCRLLTSYASLCGTEHAHHLFVNLPNRTTRTCNHMLKALVDQNAYRSAFGLYSDLLRDVEVLPDPVTFSIVLKACVDLKWERGGKMVHAQVLIGGCEGDLRLMTDLLQFYLKFGCLDFARKLFKAMSWRDAFVWTVMIDGLMKMESYADAIECFQNMRDSGLKAADVTWNTLVSGFARNGLYTDALHHIRLMQMDGVKPGGVTLSSILPMFAQNAILKPGLETHAYVIRNGFESNLFMVSALVDMYAKSGKMTKARSLFEQAEVRDDGLWNAIIVGYGMHGNCKEALLLFDSMIDAGVQQNEITFTAVLSACSHGGMVSEGLRVFGLLVDNYNISSRHEHFACMVDMLGRAGLLKEAYEFIQRMPMEPTKDVWGAFLGACRIHAHVNFMKIAAKHISESSRMGETTGYRVMLSNLYAESGEWGAVAKLRTQIRDERVKKTGYSWIEIGDSIHKFSVADSSHPQSREIYCLLRNLDADISRISLSYFRELFSKHMQI